MAGGLATAWRDAGRDLGIEVIAPYCLDGEVEYSALVVGFGSDKGMLVLDRWDQERMAAAERAGFGYSCMGSPYYELYERERFIDVLNDWGWTGSSDTAPGWYSESIDGDGDKAI